MNIIEQQNAIMTFIDDWTKGATDDAPRSVICAYMMQTYNNSKATTHNRLKDLLDTRRLVAVVRGQQHSYRRRGPSDDVVAPAPPRHDEALQAIIAIGEKVLAR